MKVLLLLLAVLVAAVHMVSGLSSGAPPPACSTLTPQHGSNAAQTTPSPHIVDLSDFNVTVDDDTMEATIYYFPDAMYAITLMATGEGQFSNFFRGFLLQGRTYADDTVVGTFMDAPDEEALYRLSSCERSDGAVTHNSPEPKTNITVYWTAPPAGTGPIYFGHAFVWSFTTFWPNLRTAPILEVGGDNDLPEDNDPPEDNNVPQENSAIGNQVPTCLLIVSLFGVIIAHLL